MAKRMLVLVTDLQMSFTSEWVEFLRAEPAALKDKSIQISLHNVSSRKARVRTLQFKDILIQILIQNVSPRVGTLQRIDTDSDLHLGRFSERSHGESSLTPANFNCTCTT